MPLPFTPPLKKCSSATLRTRRNWALARTTSFSRWERRPRRAVRTEPRWARADRRVPPGAGGTAEADGGKPTESLLLTAWAILGQDAVMIRVRVDKKNERQLKAVHKHWPLVSMPKLANMALDVGLQRLKNLLRARFGPDASLLFSPGVKKGKRA